MVTGLSRADLALLSRAALGRDEWTSVLRVAVSREGPAVAGDYAVVDGALRFTPMFPLEPGRTYVTQFDPGAIPGGGHRGETKVARSLTIPSVPRSSAVSVVAIYPGGETVPANLLRMYIEFSGPMGARGGRNYITLLDGRGEPITDALLPLDTELWNQEHTRLTVLFDPGRVKRGILPNRRMGRPLAPGASFSVIVNPAWPDAQGAPLVSEYRREYRVGDPIERPLDPADWMLSSPASGSHDPLVVGFPWGLDRALLEHTISVLRGGAVVGGVMGTGSAERQWTFTPHAAWQRGDYILMAQPELEDPAGNRVGHAFETTAGTHDSAARPPLRVAFVVR